MPSFEYEPSEGLWRLESGLWYPGRLLRGTVRESHRSGGRVKRVLTLKFDVWVPGAAGRGETQVPCFIVRPHTVWRLMHLARALGKESDYQAGTFDPMEYTGSIVHCLLKQLDTCMSVDDFAPIPRDLGGTQPVKYKPKTKRPPRPLKADRPLDDHPF